VLVGVDLIVPDKHKLGERPPVEIDKARIRLVTESVFSTLKGQMRMETYLAKTLPGLAQRIGPNDYSRSPSACPSTPPSAAHTAPSPPTRTINPHQSSRFRHHRGDSER